MSDPGGYFQHAQQPAPDAGQLPVFGAPAPAHTSWAGPPPRSANRRRSFPLWAALVVAGAGVLVIVLAVTVAIPVYLNQRNTAAAAGYRVSAPDQIDGFTRSKVGAAKAAVANALSGLPPSEAAQTTALAYTDSTGTVRILVVVEKRVVPVGQVDDAIAGEERGFRDSTGTSARFDGVSTGSLGGRMECGILDPTRAICMFANPGSFGSVYLGSLRNDAGVAALRALQAVLQRS